MGSNEHDTRLHFAYKWTGHIVAPPWPALCCGCSFGPRKCSSVSNITSLATHTRSGTGIQHVFGRIRFAKIPSLHFFVPGFTHTSCWALHLSTSLMSHICTTLRPSDVSCSKLCRRKVAPSGNFKDIVLYRPFAGIVNLCEEWNPHEALYHTIGITQVHIPTLDHTSPSIEHCLQAVAVIRAHVDRYPSSHVANRLPVLMCISYDVTGMRQCVSIVRRARAVQSLLRCVSWWMHLG